MLYRNSVRGFTLIEMIVVVVMLAVLAVAAAPRFFNVQNDARSAALNGFKAAMITAAGQVYGKSVVEGVDKQPKAFIEINSQKVEVFYGYPRAKFSEVWERLLAGTFGENPYDDPAEYEWMWHNPKADVDGLYFMPRHYTSKNQKCYVKYLPPASAEQDYMLEMVTDGC